MTELKKKIETLIEKAASARTADEAMKYSQAALNGANALCSMATADQL
jgi:hypothetical protein